MNRGALADSSNFGDATVALAAPGDNLTSTYTGGDSSYATGSGTSYAAPLVAAAAAMAMGYQPTLSPAQARDAVLAGVDYRPFLDCDLFHRCVTTGGSLNLRNTLLAAAARADDAPLGLYWKHALVDDARYPENDADGRAEAGERVDLAVTLRNAGAAAASGLYATLSTSSADVTVTDDTAWYGDLDAGERALPAAGHDFGVTVAAGCAANALVTFDLSVFADGGLAWTDTFDQQIFCEGAPTSTSTRSPSTTTPAAAPSATATTSSSRARS